MLFVASILLFGFVTDRFLNSILFLFLFTGFRLTSGGYHAPKQWICTIISYTCAIGTLILSPLLPTIHFVMWLLIYLILALIIFKAPLVEHPNKQFTDTEKHNLKKKKYLCLSIMTLAEIIFCYTNSSTYYKLITVSCFIIVLSILTGIYKNSKGVYSHVV